MSNIKHGIPGTDQQECCALQSNSSLGACPLHLLCRILSEDYLVSNAEKEERRTNVVENKRKQHFVEDGEFPNYLSLSLNAISFPLGVSLTMEERSLYKIKSATQHTHVPRDGKIETCSS